MGQGLEEFDRETAHQPAKPLRQGLLSIALHHKLLVALGIILGVAFGALYYTQRTPVYRSDAQVLVIKKRPDALPGAGTQSWVPYFEDHLADHQVLIRSPLIVGRAIQKPELRDLTSLAAPADPVSQIIASLAVSRDPREFGGFSNVLRLSFRGSVAEDCDTILRAVIESYRDFLDESYRNVSNETLELVTKARDVIQKDLTEKEAAYCAFRQKSPLLWRGKEAANLHQDRLASIEAKRAGLLVQQTDVRGRLAAIESDLKNGLSRAELLATLPQLSMVTYTDGVKRVSSTSLEEQLLPLLQQEQMLLKDYGWKHPEVQSVRTRIDLTRKLFAFANAGHNRTPEEPSESDNAHGVDPLELYIRSLKQELSHLEISQRLLTEMFQNEYEESRRLANYEIQEEIIRGDIVRGHQLYDGVIKRLQEIDLIRDFGGYDARVISPAGTGRKIAPLPQYVFPTAALLGLVGGFGLVYLVDRSDKSFRTVEEVRRRLGLPILGNIPAIPSAFPASPTGASQRGALDPLLCTFYESDSPQAESYRGVRTALYSLQGKEHQVIQITSPNRADGKTTLVANLGVSIAQSGKSTILIEADFRRPRLHAAFGLSAEIGLASVLQGHAELSDAVQPSGIEGLSILPCGPIPPNPAELLTSPRFREVLDTIRQQYVFALVDTPPVLAVTDPCIVATCVDGVLLNIGLAKHGRLDAERAKEILDILGIKLLGIVVNRVDLHNRGPGYSNYAYGYSDAYGNEMPKSKPSELLPIHRSWRTRR